MPTGPSRVTVNEKSAVAAAGSSSSGPSPSPIGPGEDEPRPVTDQERAALLPEREVPAACDMAVAANQQPLGAAAADVEGERPLRVARLRNGEADRSGPQLGTLVRHPGC